jgi:hypothetical protein
MDRVVDVKMARKNPPPAWSPFFLTSPQLTSFWVIAASCFAAILATTIS